jgi:hypothetical protein
MLYDFAARKQDTRKIAVWAAPFVLDGYQTTDEYERTWPKGEQVTEKRLSASNLV